MLLEILPFFDEFGQYNVYFMHILGNICCLNVAKMWTETSFDEILTYLTQ